MPSINQILRIIIFTGLAIFTFSCSGTKKLSELVNNNTTTQLAASSRVSVVASTTTKENTVERQSGKFIPALVYWGWDNNIHLGLSSAYLEKTLNNALSWRIDSLVASNQLAEADYQFTIRDFPYNFSYRNDGYAVFLLVAYSASVSESITPLENYALVEYEVSQAGEQLTSGELTYRELLQPASNHVHSTKRFVGDYFNYLEQSIDRIAHSLVGELQRLETR